MERNRKATSQPHGDRQRGRRINRCLTYDNRLASRCLTSPSPPLRQSSSPPLRPSSSPLLRPSSAARQTSPPRSLLQLHHLLLPWDYASLHFYCPQVFFWGWWWWCNLNSQTCQPEPTRVGRPANSSGQNLLHQNTTFRLTRKENK